MQLHPYRIGVALSVLAILLGFGLGGLFGGFEDELKAGLTARAEAVRAERYGGSAEAAKKVVDKAWAYHERAHMHWGGIGAATLALTIALALMRGSGGAARATSAALGLGALLYPLAWLLAGRSAPGLGSTDAGKQGWELLFQVPAGLLILGTLAALLLLASAPRRPEA